MIEFQYFKGCPNSTATLKNLKNLIKKGLLSEDKLVIVEVPDLNTAEKVNFQGSPTILHNGYDIDTGNKPDSFNYTCRIYEIEGKKTGILPEYFIQINKMHE